MINRLIQRPVLLLLLVCLTGSSLLLSQSVPAVIELEKRLETASGREKFQLYYDFALTNLRKHPDKSRQYLELALKWAETDGDSGDAFDVLKLTGNWYYIQTRYSDAVKYYLKALDLEQRISSQKKVAGVLTNIGMVYWKLADYKTSWGYHNRALELRKKTKNTPYEMGMTFNNLGLAIEGRGKKENNPYFLKKARNYYLQALEQYKQGEFKRGTASALLNLANVNDKLKNTETALKLYHKALGLYKELGLDSWVADIFWRTGLINFDLRRYSEAEKDFSAGLKIAGANNDTEHIQPIRLGLSRVYDVMGYPEKAFRFHQKYAMAKADAFKKKNDKHVALTRVNIEILKKQREILLLEQTVQGELHLKLHIAAMLLLLFGLVAALYTRSRTKKRIAALLEQEEARYRILFSLAGEAIFLLDGNRISDCNRKASDMFLLSPEEMIGATTPDLSLPPETGETMKRGKPCRFNRTFVKKDGTAFDAVVSLNPVTIDRESQTLAFVRDVTESKQLEEERVKSAKLKTTGVIAGGIAHDLDHVLGVLHDDLDRACTEAGTGPGIPGLLRNIETALNSATALANLFRSISEKEFKPKTARPIAPLIRESVQSVLDETGSRCHCHFDLPGGLYPIPFHPGQIATVLVNLTRNALDAMASGGDLFVKAANVQLEKGDVPLLPPGSYVAVSVRDTGKGIPPEYLSRIFDPYFSTRNDYSRAGRGMGLMIAQAIVRRHNGAFDVSSRVQIGTQFRFYLPAAIGDRK